MAKENVNGIFFTEQEDDFGKLFNEFNTYIRDLDADMKIKEESIFTLGTALSSDSVIQALDSYSSTDLDSLKSHFRALNDAFDSVSTRIENALNAIIT
jgi:hypothetical protein